MSNTLFFRTLVKIPISQIYLELSTWALGLPAHLTAWGLNETRKLWIGISKAGMDTCFFLKRVSKAGMDTCFFSKQVSKAGIP